MAPVGGEAGKKSNRSSPQKTKTAREQSSGSQETSNRGQTDDQSDRGTYTIELENGNAEEEEARRMIDKVDVQLHKNYKFGLMVKDGNAMDKRIDKRVERVTF